MRHPSTVGGRLIAAAVAVAAVAALTSAGSVFAAPSDTVTVTGGSASKIELTLGDTTAQFGSTLTPDGDASNSSDPGVNGNVDPSNPSTGTCYEWPGSARVRSNVQYVVKVGATAANGSLDFLTSNPATFASCTGGEPVAANMFTSASPVGSWTANQSRTNGRDHPFWLGLAVLWTDAPSGTLATASLTLTAVAN